jgi:hypothetical protein
MSASLDNSFGIHREFIGASYGESERKEAEGYDVERRMREID